MLTKADGWEVRMLGVVNAEWKPVEYFIAVVSATTQGPAVAIIPFVFHEGGLVAVNGTLRKRVAS